MGGESSKSMISAFCDPSILLASARAARLVDGIAEHYLHHIGFLPHPGLAVYQDIAHISGVVFVAQAASVDRVEYIWSTGIIHRYRNAGTDQIARSGAPPPSVLQGLGSPR